MNSEEEKLWIEQTNQDLLVCPICNTPYYGKVDYDVLGCQNECTGTPMDPGGQEKSVFDGIIFYYSNCGVLINRFEFNSHPYSYNMYATISITNRIPFDKFLKHQNINEFQLPYNKKNIDFIFNLAREKKLEKISEYMLKINKLLPNDQKEQVFHAIIDKDIDSLDNLTIFT